MMEIDWNEAPDDAEFAGTVCGDQESVFYRNVSSSGYDYIYPSVCSWTRTKGVPACLPLIPRPAAPIWTGEGNPPVGTVCERRTRTEAVDGRYEKVTIIAHTSKGFPVWENTDGMFAGISKTQRMGDHPEFRPIRTPEQIAAEERDKAVQAAMDDTYTLGISDQSKRILIERLYDAGYRKQVTECKFPQMCSTRCECGLKS